PPGRPRPGRTGRRADRLAPARARRRLPPGGGPRAPPGDGLPVRPVLPEPGPAVAAADPARPAAGTAGARPAPPRPRLGRGGPEHPVAAPDGRTRPAAPAR